MARKKTSAIENERREIRRIFNERALVPSRVIRFTMKVMGGMADAFPTRKAGEYWCDHCGERFTGDFGGRKLKGVCPHCGAHFTAHPGGEERQRGYSYNYARYTVRPRTHRTDHYIREITVYKGWQVVKEYFVSKHARIGERPRYDICPVYSIWMNPASRRTHILALPTIGLGMWYARTPFSLSGNYRFVRGGDVGHNLYNGWRDDTLVDKLLTHYPMHGCPDNHEKMLAAYTEAGTELETLTKTGHREAVALAIDDSRARRIITDCWRGIVIALRHGYGARIEEIGWGTYIDYLKELKDLHLDWHSPHYLCPKDFFAAHADTSHRLARKMRERAERMEAGRQRAVLERDVRLKEERERGFKEFDKRIKRYVGLVISGEGLSIRPLLSVSEFFDEGTAMHHCVYSNRYYARPESLILTARDDEGKRVETVEVDLDRYDIVQSRAVCNGVSDRHDDILRLVTEAMPEIRRLSGKKNIKNINRLSA